MEHAIRTKPSPRSPRETELLAVTLQLLQEHGYERLTLDAVAATAKASKATLYQRWPSKAELVLAAVIDSITGTRLPPTTGSLRADLLRAGESICEQVCPYSGAVRAVLVEVSRRPRLNEFMRKLVNQHRAMIRRIVADAADRGEIDPEEMRSDTWDVLPAYLIYRSTISPRPPDRCTVQALVDHVIMPSLTRGRR